MKDMIDIISPTLRYQINSDTKKANKINACLAHLLLKATGKKLYKKKYFIGC